MNAELFDDEMKEIEPLTEENLQDIKNNTEYDLAIKSFENIEQKLNEMNTNLENSVKWISNICIMIILGMIVLVLIVAAITINIISKFM